MQKYPEGAERPGLVLKKTVEAGDNIVRRFFCKKIKPCLMDVRTKGWHSGKWKRWPRAEL